MNLPGDSLNDPIDVDSCPLLFEPAQGQDYVKKEEISLGKDVPPPKIISNTSYTAWDAYGKKEMFTPEFHYATFHARMKNLMAKLDEGLIEDQPPFLSCPEKSQFKLIPYDIFLAMDAPTLQHHMSKKHIVITHIPHNKETKFGESAICTLIGSLNSQVSINDFSVECSDKTTSLIQVVSGYTSDILVNERSNGQILNGLDFPMGDADRRPNKYAVDLDACDITCGFHQVPLTSSYLTEHMRWGAAGTRNTLTFVHIDCDGLNTNDGPICGSKLWAVMERLLGSKPLSSIHFFLDEEAFVLDDVPAKVKYRFEGIVLRSSDILFMKANTPHFVYGMEAAVCHGGHYYMTSLMQDTLQGVIHAFILNNFLTNTSHWPTCQIFHHILLFYHLGLMEESIPSSDQSFVHLPDVKTIDGILNLLSVCILVILGNVLDFCTYKAANQDDDESATPEQAYLINDCDVNAIPYFERVAQCYARGVAFYIMQWIQSCATIRGPSQDIIPDLPYQFLVQIIQSLQNYKLAAGRRHLGGVPHCTYLKLKSQIENIVNANDTINSVWKTRSGLPSDSLSLADKDRYSVEWSSGWQPNWKTPQDFVTMGLTSFDSKYFQATRKYAGGGGVTASGGPEDVQVPT
ncbi:hypothetical protein CPB84DRAFT_1690553 [Gymnopilus junonius]|uniref:Uncharacterized protein n=1 Tax=Gymnopilus junonius TaxID=109634 RepID=A0A9P5TFA9_GYMJU|nr:hypothetical protein CPB84DRAFT_1690553 [Gymnopilus junonius]